MSFTLGNQRRFLVLATLAVFVTAIPSAVSQTFDQTCSTPSFPSQTATAIDMQKVADSGLPVRVTGHLFFDSSHVPCENGQGVRSNPKRVSLWEVHPIYQFELCTADCGGTGTWVSLDQWAKTQ